jgi:ABC-type sugar transport system substrate-binding protein
MRKPSHCEHAGLGASKSTAARLLVLLGLAILFASLLAACGGGSGSTSSSSTTAESPNNAGEGTSTEAASKESESAGPTTKQPTAKYVRWSEPKASPELSKIFGISVSEDSGVFAQFVEAGEKQSESCEMESSAAASESNAATQVNQLNSFVQRGAGAVFAQDFEPAAEEPVLHTAMEEGIGVTSFNMNTTTQIAASQVAAGELEAETVLEYIKDNLNNEAEVVHFNVEFVLPEREEGYNAVMAKAPPGVHVVANIPGNPETEATGNKAMASALQAHPGISVVDGTDAVVLGAKAAVEAAGKEEEIALIGFNGDPQAVKAVEEGGPYKATVGYDFAVMGALAGQYACDWVEGYNVPQLVLVNGFVISSKQGAKEFEADVKQATTDPAAAIREGEGKYYDAYGSISSATKDNYYEGTPK